ncbi:uncharacterized protein J7T54_003428 [Emericellopsis cladophorae]|uniref:Uncharacterized protein n=1 Tax=Emericellopsis cladophorae TaxID=2686198 RepID=A0A9P9Y304_9HYPO|nr:uncharacterized protein J7T54_003428 [Emericellopsis cladophorae]KAI6782009.1 hypothetical protein J7T54_003428 [Emericellopsis cladophorae]
MQSHTPSRTADAQAPAATQSSNQTDVFKLPDAVPGDEEHSTRGLDDEIEQRKVAPGEAAHLLPQNGQSLGNAAQARQTSPIILVDDASSATEGNSDSDVQVVDQHPGSVRDQLLFEDSDDDDSPSHALETTEDLFPHQTRLVLESRPNPPEARNFHIDSDASSDMEDNNVDHMVLDPKRQSRLSDQFQKPTKTAKRSNTAPKSRSTPRQPRIDAVYSKSKTPSESLAEKFRSKPQKPRRRQAKAGARLNKSRPSLPQLSILDVIEPDAPQFLKIAARTAKKRHRSPDTPSRLRPAQLESDEMGMSAVAFHASKKILDQLYHAKHLPQPPSTGTLRRYSFQPLQDRTKEDDAFPRSPRPQNQRRRKQKPQQINVDDPQFTHARDPVIQDYDHTDLSLSEGPNVNPAADVEKFDVANKLSGLGAYGTAYTHHFECLPLPSGVYFYHSTLLGKAVIETVVDSNFMPKLKLQKPRTFFSIGPQTLRWGLWDAQVSSEMGIVFDHIAEYLEGDQCLESTSVDAAHFLVSYVSNFMTLETDAETFAAVTRMLELLEGFSAKVGVIAKSQGYKQIILRVMDCLCLVAFVVYLICRGDPNLVGYQLTAEERLKVLASALSRVLGTSSIKNLRNRYRTLQVTRHVSHNVVGSDTTSTNDARILEGAWETLFTLLPLTEFNDRGVLVTGQRPQTPNVGKVEPEDQCFHIFLKMLALGICRLRAGEHTKEIRNMVARTVPNHNRQYMKEHHIHERDLAALRNHHDLLCTLYWAAPPTVRPSVALIERLVHPETSHKEACLISLRAWSQLARFVVSNGEATTSMKPFNQWRDRLFTQMMQQYDTIASDIQQQFLGLSSDVSKSVSPDMISAMVKLNKNAVADVVHVSLSTSLDVIKHTQNLEAATFALNTQQLQRILQHFSSPRPEFDWGMLRTALLTLDVFLSRVDDFKDAEESQQSESQLLNSAQADDALLSLDHDLASNFFQMARRVLILNPDAEQSCLASVDMVACIEHVVKLGARMGMRFINAGVMTFNSIFKPGKHRLFQDKPHLLGFNQRRYLTLFVETLVERGFDGFCEDGLSLCELWVLAIVKSSEALAYENRLAQRLIRQGEPFVPEAAQGLSISPSYRTNRDMFEFAISWMRKAIRDAGPSQKRALQAEHSRILKLAMEQMRRDLGSMHGDSSQHRDYIKFVRECIELIKAHGTDICTVDDFFYQISKDYSPSEHDPQLQVAAIVSYGLRLAEGESRAAHELFYFLVNNFKVALMKGDFSKEVDMIAKGMRHPGISRFVVGAMLPAIIQAAFVESRAYPMLDVYGSWSRLLLKPRQARRLQNIYTYWTKL